MPYVANAPVRKGTWTVVADPTAARQENREPQLGAPALWTPLAHPVNYFQMTFPAYAGKSYHLWVRGEAAGNSTSNDSVFIQWTASNTASALGVALAGVPTCARAPASLATCSSFWRVRE